MYSLLLLPLRGGEVLWRHNLGISGRCLIAPLIAGRGINKFVTVVASF
jgi:hypothetical protein